MTCIFPNEIVQCIIEQSSQKVAYQWIFVCKYWSNVAALVFYKNLSSREIRIRKLIRQLHRYKKSERSTVGLFQNAHLIHKLKIWRGRRQKLVGKDDDWFLLLQFLPNLKIIDMSSALSPMEYLWDLFGLSYRPEMKDLNLKQIIAFQLEDADYIDPALASSYLQTCHKYRHTLTHMQLFDVNKTDYFRQIENSYSSYLPAFKNLTHLTIVGDYPMIPFLANLTHASVYYRKNNNTEERIESDLLESCPTHPVNKIV